MQQMANDVNAVWERHMENILTTLFFMTPGMVFRGDNPVMDFLNPHPYGNGRYPEIEVETQEQRDKFCEEIIDGLNSRVFEFDEYGPIFHEDEAELRKKLAWQCRVGISLLIAAEFDFIDMKHQAKYIESDGAWQMRCIYCGKLISVTFYAWPVGVLTRWISPFQDPGEHQKELHKCGKLPYGDSIPINKRVEPWVRN